MAEGYKRWDPAASFADDEDARLFVADVASDGDPDATRLALGALLRHLGAEVLASRSDVSRKEIFGALTSIESDDVDLLQRVLGTVGVSLSSKSDQHSDAAE